MQALLDGRADQRFQVLLTPALKAAAKEAAQARKISLGKLIRLSLAEIVDRRIVHRETIANEGIHPSHEMGEWSSTIVGERFARLRTCENCQCEEYTTVAGKGRDPDLTVRCTE